MIEQVPTGAAPFAHTSHNPANANSPPSGPGRPGLEGGAVAAAAERGAHRDAHVRDGRHARLTKRFLHREDGELLGVVPQRLTLDHDAPGVDLDAQLTDPPPGALHDPPLDDRPELHPTSLNRGPPEHPSLCKRRARPRLAGGLRVVLAIHDHLLVFPPCWSTPTSSGGCPDGGVAFPPCWKGPTGKAQNGRSRGADFQEGSQRPAGFLPADCRPRTRLLGRKGLWAGMRTSGLRRSFRLTG